MFFHVDINSYFATMLQQENPFLRGKPIGVVKDIGRTCIIASSNEAKRLGIKTGCRVPEARKLVPSLILVPAAFDVFLSSTKQLKQVFSSLCPDVTIFSLDEAFLDMTGCETLMRQLINRNNPSPVIPVNLPAGRQGRTTGSPIRNPVPDTKTWVPVGVYPAVGGTGMTMQINNDLHLAFGKLIQSRIKSQLGEWVQCNVGIAKNKLLAKMAGEISPKGSVFTINEENLDTILSQTTFADVCGVGHRLERRLTVLGVTTPYQINLLSDDVLTEHFGPFWSKELRKIGRGEETHFFTHAPTVDHMQSVGRTITGYKLCDDEDHIKRTLLNLLEEATYKMRRMNLAGRGIGVSLHGHDAHWGKHVTLKYYVRHTNEIFSILYDQLYRSWRRTFPVIKFGVWVFALTPCQNIPLCLLPEFQKNERLYEAMDAVNNRFGLFTIKPASLLTGKIIRPEVTGYLGDKTFYGL